MNKNELKIAIENASSPPSPLNNEWIQVYCKVYFYTLDLSNNTPYNSPNKKSFHYIQEDVLSQLPQRERVIVILELIKAAQTDYQLSIIAAGPLEDNIGRDEESDAMIDEAVKNCKNMQKAICGVWHNRDTPQGKVLHVILEKYRLTSSSF